MSLRLLGWLVAGLLAAVLATGWFLLPRIWPGAVVAYSPLLGPAIRAEAWRRTGGSPLVPAHWVAYVPLDQRLRRDPAAGATALLAALRDGDVEVRRVAARELQQLRLDATNRRTLLERAAGHAGDADARVRAHLIAMLADADAHDRLVVAALRDPAAEVRLAAVNGLTPRRDARLLPEFLRLVDDRNDGVACAAVWALGRLGLDEAIEPLLRVLAGNRPGAVGAAGNALRGLRLAPEQRRRMLAGLVAALRDDGVRWSALSAEWLLQDQRDGLAEELLRDALGDPDYQCRQFAADLLRARGAAPDARLVAATIEGLRDDDYPEARDGSHHTGLRNAKDGTRWLWLHPDAGTPGLREALASPDAQQRFLAAWLLAMRQDAASADAICAALLPRLRESAGKPAAAWAIMALYRLGPAARPHAQSALPAADARQTACIQLLLRDWTDPPRSTAEAARRGRLPLSVLYHDPAWEPALQAPGLLPEPFPQVR
jgi:HEAT repeat protein